MIFHMTGAHIRDSVHAFNTHQLQSRVWGYRMHQTHQCGWTVTANAVLSYAQSEVYCVHQHDMERFQLRLIEHQHGNCIHTCNIHWACLLVCDYHKVNTTLSMTEASAEAITYLLAYLEPNTTYFCCHRGRKAARVWAGSIK